MTDFDKVHKLTVMYLFTRRDDPSSLIAHEAIVSTLFLLANVLTLAQLEEHRTVMGYKAYPGVACSNQAGEIFCFHLLFSDTAADKNPQFPRCLTSAE